MSASAVSFVGFVIGAFIGDTGNEWPETPSSSYEEGEGPRWMSGDDWVGVSRVMAGATAGRGSVMCPPVAIPASMVSGHVLWFVGYEALEREGGLKVAGNIVCWTASGEWQPGWAPRGSDVLACDWRILSGRYGSKE